MVRSSLVYPITFKTESDLLLVAHEMGLEEQHKEVQMMVDTLGEYEHGTADIEDVFPVLWEDLTAERMNTAMSEEEEEQIQKEARNKLLTAYADVVNDLGLTILSQI